MVLSIQQLVIVVVVKVDGRNKGLERNYITEEGEVIVAPSEAISHVFKSYVVIKNLSYKNLCFDKRKTNYIDVDGSNEADIDSLVVCFFVTVAGTNIQAVNMKP